MNGVRVKRNVYLVEHIKSANCFESWRENGSYQFKDLNTLRDINDLIYDFYQH